ncbi:MAG: NAD-dependent protein deacetylase [Myxococcota bacterium]
MDTSITAAVDVLRGQRVVVLTGAGMSTASGIPDYRGPKTRRFARNPVQFKAFVSDPEARRRYWSRAAVGWPRIAAAQPNAAHRAIAGLQRAGVVHGLITQNVDGLHGAAGSTGVELHGTLSRVRCLQCGVYESRDALQTRLLALNPALADVTAAVAPDGDAELPEGHTEAFVMAACQACEGPLKPDVVFFGESVPADVTAAAWSAFARAQALLVAGSSLTVFSGYRFVRRAARDGIPVVIVNQGPTRGDPQAAVCIDADVTEVLPRLLEALSPDDASGDRAGAVG